MVRLIIALLVIGCMVAYFGFREFQLGQAASPNAKHISCAELGSKGPGDNAHVLLENHVLCQSGFVYESKNGNASERWTTIWIPAVPIDGEYVQEIKRLMEVSNGKRAGSLPLPKDVHVLIKSKRVHDQSDLDRLDNQDTIQGVVINKIDSIGSQEKKLLSEQYPGIDFDKCWIIEHGREPSGPAKSFGMMGGGAALAGLGVLGMVAKIKKQ